MERESKRELAKKAKRERGGSGSEREAVWVVKSTCGVFPVEDEG
jgi:hypothetical protein